MCGERSARDAAIRRADGSSPRVRGTRRHTVDRPNKVRFIPACAGNAARRYHISASTAVHPRVCGERTKFRDKFLNKRGSSPRVRGTLPRRYPASRTNRFIPACAGNATAQHVAIFAKSVHPRVCGERSSSVTPKPMAYGSSPRVRGTPEIPEVPAHLIRFIPACAGNAMGIKKLKTRRSVHPRVCGERLCRL